MPKSLLGKLNPTCQNSLFASIGMCSSRSHHHVEIEHWLLSLLEVPNTDLVRIMKRFEIDPNRARKELNDTVNRFKSGYSGQPSLTDEILDLVQEAWVLGSLEYGAAQVRSSHLVLALLNHRMLTLRLQASCPELAKIPAKKLTDEFRDMVHGTVEDVA